MIVRGAIDEQAEADIAELCLVGGHVDEAPRDFGEHVELSGLLINPNVVALAPRDRRAMLAFVTQLNHLR